MAYPKKDIDFSAFDNAVKQTPTDGLDFSAFDKEVKKKDTQLSAGLAKPKESVSETPSTSQKGAFSNAPGTSGFANQFPKQQYKKINSITDLIPDADKHFNVAAKDNTYMEKPITDVDVKEKLVKAEQHKKDMEDAIDNTTKAALKNRGIWADKGTPLYNEQRKKIVNMTKPTMIGGVVVAQPDATYVMGKDGKPGLSRTIGWWEGAVRGWNEAMNAEDEAEAFNNMTTDEKVAYVNKVEAEKPPTEFIGEHYGLAGSGTHLLTSSAPFLLKAAGGATLGAMTGGTGAPLIMSIAATAPDMINQGMQNEVMARYNQLKKENPDADDFELMKMAESGQLSGAIQGAAEDLLFIGTGLKAPLSGEVKQVLGKNLIKSLESSAHVGAISGGIHGAALAERAAEGYKVDPQEAISESVNVAVDSFNGMLALNGIIHGVTGMARLPKNVMSALKYSLKDTNPKEIQAALSANEKAGKIPEGTTNAVMNDITGYNAQLEKVNPNLSPEAQASIAGLMQARDNVQKEMMTKDISQHEPYKQKIDAYTEQIKKITETGEPFKHEIDDVTGKPLDGKGIEVKTETTTENGKPITEQVTEPIQPNESATKEQGSKEGVSESTETTGQRNAETATTVLESGIVETDNAIMEGSYGNEITINDENVKLPNKGFVISDVSLKEGKEKGAGSGQEIYKKALDQYGTLYSFHPVSEDAMRVQNKLVEKGIAKIEIIELPDGSIVRKIKKSEPSSRSQEKGTEPTVVEPNAGKEAPKGQEPESIQMETVEGTPPKEQTAEAKVEPEPKDKKKALLNRLMNAEYLSDESKSEVEKQGLEYTPKNQTEAEKIAKDIVDEYGIDDAVLRSKANEFGGDVNTLVQTEALNRLKELEDKATTKEEKTSYAVKFAEVAKNLDDWLRKKGQSISALQHFYKKSPLGMRLMENARRKEEFEKWSKPKEQSWKDAFEELLKEPEFAELVDEKIKEGMKKERAAERAQRKEKVHKAIDETVAKWIDKLTPDSTKGVKKQGLGVEEVFKTAGAAIKKAYDAGESIVKVIDDAIAYITKELGYSGWGEPEFRKEQEARLRDRISSEEAYKNRLRNQIEDLDKQIENKKRVSKTKTEKEYDAETNELIKERDEKKKLLTEVAGTLSDEQILGRIRKQLKGLSNKEQVEVVRKVRDKLIAAGGLKYDEFRDIIAQATGRGELTDAEAKRMEELVDLTNKVDEAAQRAMKEKTKESRIAHTQSQIEAARASRELADMMETKPDIAQTLTSLMQLNTLGIPALVNNPVYNLMNQVGVRLPVSVFNTVLDQALKYGAKAIGKEYNPETNILNSQVEFFSKLWSGGKEAVQQFATGLDRMDYTQKELHTTGMRPAKSLKDLYKAAKGEKKLSKTQIIDKSLRGTLGVPAELVARVLNLGDKPMRFASEGAQASVFAKQLGLKGIDYELFIDFPREMAYEQYKKQGLSDAEAAKKADYIKDIIVKEGQRSTFQQDNMLNDLLNKITSGKGSGTKNLVKAATISPYIKIPTNAYWSYFNLKNPEIALLQSLWYASKAGLRKANPDRKFMTDKAEKTYTAEKDLHEARYWLAHAATGMAMRAVIASLVTNGIFRPANTKDETKKEREGENYYEQQGSINMSKLWAYINGKDPSKIENGFTISNRWGGQFGSMGNDMAKQFEDATPEERAKKEEFFNIAIGGMEKDAAQDLQQGVFSNTAAILEATGKNGNPSRYGVGVINLLTNIFHPAMSAQISRAQLPYYTKSKGDDFASELKNSFAARSSFLRSGEISIPFSNNHIKVFKGIGNPPAKITPYGEIAEKGDNTFMRLFGFSNNDKNNFARKIYNNDYKRTGDTRFLPPSIKPEVNGIKLNSDEFTKLEIEVGKKRKLLLDPYVNDMAKFEDDKKLYSKLSDGEKIKKLNAIYEIAHEAGVAEFIKNNPGFDKKEKSQSEKQSDKKESKGSRYFREKLRNKAGIKK